MLQNRQLSPDTISTVVTQVFRSGKYAEHSAPSLFSLLIHWLAALIRALVGFASAHSAVGMILRIALAVALIFLVARIAYALFLGYSPAIARTHASTMRGTDWRVTAARLAAAGDYTGAAHALYLALLASVARRGLVTMHESKTTGDYVRELRSHRAPGNVAQPFTEFTRSYEVVIYGLGECDAERYGRLDAIAGELLGTGA